MLVCDSPDVEFSEAFPADFDSSEDVDSTLFSSALFDSDAPDVSDDSDDSDDSNSLMNGDDCVDVIHATPRPHVSSPDTLSDYVSMHGSSTAPQAEGARAGVSETKNARQGIEIFPGAFQRVRVSRKTRGPQPFDMLLLVSDSTDSSASAKSTPPIASQGTCVPFSDGVVPLHMVTARGSLSDTTFFDDRNVSWPLSYVTKNGGSARNPDDASSTGNAERRSSGEECATVSFPVGIRHESTVTRRAIVKDVMVADAATPDTPRRAPERRVDALGDPHAGRDDAAQLLQHLSIQKIAVVSRAVPVDVQLKPSAGVGVDVAVENLTRASDPATLFGAIVSRVSNASPRHTPRLWGLCEQMGGDVVIDLTDHTSTKASPWSGFGEAHRAQAEERSEWSYLVVDGEALVLKYLHLMPTADRMMCTIGSLWEVDRTSRDVAQKAVPGRLRRRLTGADIDPTMRLVATLRGAAKRLTPGPSPSVIALRGQFCCNIAATVQLLLMQIISQNPATDLMDIDLCVGDAAGSFRCCITEGDRAGLERLMILNAAFAAHHHIGTDTFTALKDTVAPDNFLPTLDGWSSGQPPRMRSLTRFGIAPMRRKGTRPGASGHAACMLVPVEMVASFTLSAERAATSAPLCVRVRDSAAVDMMAQCMPRTGGVVLKIAESLMYRPIDQLNEYTNACFVGESLRVLSALMVSHSDRERSGVSPALLEVLDLAPESVPAFLFSKRLTAQQPPHDLSVQPNTSKTPRPPLRHTAQTPSSLSAFDVGVVSSLYLGAREIVANTGQITSLLEALALRTSRAKQDFDDALREMFENTADDVAGVAATVEVEVVYPPGSLTDFRVVVARVPRSSAPMTDAVLTHHDVVRVSRGGIAIVTFLNGGDRSHCLNLRMNAALTLLKSSSVDGCGAWSFTADLMQYQLLLLTHVGAEIETRSSRTGKDVKLFPGSDAASAPRGLSLRFRRAGLASATVLDEANCLVRHYGAFTQEILSRINDVRGEAVTPLKLKRIIQPSNETETSGDGSTLSVINGVLNGDTSRPTSLAAERLFASAIPPAACQPWHLQAAPPPALWNKLAVRLEVDGQTCRFTNRILPCATCEICGARPPVSASNAASLPVDLYAQMDGNRQKASLLCSLTTEAPDVVQRAIPLTRDGCACAPEMRFDERTAFSVPCPNGGASHVAFNVRTVPNSAQPKRPIQACGSCGLYHCVPEWQPATAEHRCGKPGDVTRDGCTTRTHAKLFSQVDAFFEQHAGANGQNGDGASDGADDDAGSDASDGGNYTAQLAKLHQKKARQMADMAIELQSFLKGLTLLPACDLPSLSGDPQTPLHIQSEWNATGIAEGFPVYRVWNKGMPAVHTIGAPADMNDIRIDGWFRILPGHNNDEQHVLKIPELPSPVPVLSLAPLGTPSDTAPTLRLLNFPLLHAGGGVMFEDSTVLKQHLVKILAMDAPDVTFGDPAKMNDGTI